MIAFLRVCSSNPVSGDSVMVGGATENFLFGPSKKISADLNGLIRGSGAVGNTMGRLKKPNSISFITALSHNA